MKVIPQLVDYFKGQRTDTISDAVKLQEGKRRIDMRDLARLADSIARNQETDSGDLADVMISLGIGEQKVKESVEIVRKYRELERDCVGYDEENERLKADESAAHDRFKQAEKLLPELRRKMVEAHYALRGHCHKRVGLDQHYREHQELLQYLV